MEQAEQKVIYNRTLAINGYSILGIHNSLVLEL